jgi:hypothetical protein
VGGIEIGRSLEYQEPNETGGLLFGFGSILFGIAGFMRPYGWAVLALAILGGVGVIWGATRKKRMAQTIRGRRLDQLSIWLPILAVAIPVFAHLGAGR